MIEKIKKLYKLRYKIREIAGSSYKKYNGITDEQCFSQIMKWASNSNKTFFCKQNAEIRENSICIIVGYASVRALKIISSLAENGLHVAVLYNYYTTRDSLNLEEIKRFSNECYSYKSIEELMYETIVLDCPIIHYFTEWGNCEYANVMLMHKKLFSPIIIDIYDVINEMYVLTKGYQQKWFEYEKYCIEHADGIVTREFTIEYLKEKGYKVGGVVLQFFDYFVNNTLDENFVKKENDAEELSIFYAGGVSNEDGNDPFSCFLDLAESCEKNHCHFYVYALNYSEKYHKSLLEFERKSKYFHIKKPLPYTEYLKEISNCDYGVFPIRNNYKDVPSVGYTKEKIIYSAQNKLFDAISVGLPVISPVPVKLSEMLKNEGICFSWTVDEYCFEELKIKRNLMKKRVRENMDKWLISVRIKELIEFYNSVIM